MAKGDKIIIGPITRSTPVIDTIYNSMHEGLYVASNYSTLQIAVDAVPSGKTLIIDKDITLTAAVVITKPITIIGNNDYTIYQSTIDATCFDVKSNDVTIDGLKMLGNDDGITYKSYSITANPYPYYRDKSAVFTVGYNGANVYNLTVKNCHISNFNYGITAIYCTNFWADNNTIDYCMMGIYFSTGWSDGITPSWSNPGSSGSFQGDTSPSYKFTNNTITCTHGRLVSSRPLGGNFIGGGNIICTHNKLRGGGMAFENMVDDPLIAKGVSGGSCIFSYNDCDSGISFGTIITNNTFDRDLSPVGRGQQFDWYQCIEPSPGAIISHNTIKNHMNGVGFYPLNCVITDNYFINCGKPNKGIVGGGGSIIGVNNAFARDNYINCTIANNTFSNIDDGTSAGNNISVLAVGTNDPYDTYGVIIDNNKVFNASGAFLALTNARNIKVTNNYVYNCNNRAVGAYDWTHSAIYMSNASTKLYDGYFVGNTFINTLGTSGMNTALPVPTLGTVKFGYNEASGCRYGMYQNWITSDYAPPPFYISDIYSENGITKSHKRTRAGSPSGFLTPNWIGEIVLDTSANNFYIGYSTSSNTSWKLLT